VFRLGPPAPGKNDCKCAVLHRFAGADGCGPRGTLIADEKGALYGTTHFCGGLGVGTVFKLQRTGFMPAP
jgi:hypothetical protein